jgi:hypothetical protein
MKTKWKDEEEQELPTLSVHPSSLLVFSGVRVARSLVFCVVFCRSLFVFFLLVIVLSVLLQITVFDYPSSSFCTSGIHDELHLHGILNFVYSVN